MLLMIVDRFAWEQLYLACAFIGTKERASQVILIYLLSFCTVMGYGMQSPTNSLIGCDMVNAKVEKARGHFRTASFIFMLIVFG